MSPPPPGLGSAAADRGTVGHLPLGLIKCVLLLFFVFICLNHLIEYYKDQISIQENPNSCMVHLYDTLLSYSIKYQVKCKDIYYLQQCNVEDCLIKCRDWSNFLILHEI